MRIAIIGAGIAGLTSAWLLHDSHDVTIFEKNDYIGGHTDTHDVRVDGQTLAVDTGFIVFNTHNYPLFCHMLRELDVDWQSSNMSFSVNNLRTGLVHNPSTISSLLLNVHNVLNPRFRRTLRDLRRFYQQTRDMDIGRIAHDVTVADFLDQYGYTDDFREEHLYPMCGALWSACHSEVATLPLKFVLGFFQHHRMLQVSDRPEWLTVKGGSARYVDALRRTLKVVWQHGAQSVKRSHDQVTVQTAQGSADFDYVIFACHADQAITLLDHMTPEEARILPAFRFRPNQMVLHTDAKVMPKARSNWASWQVRVDSDPETVAPTYSFSYWMNRLQNLPTETPVLATLNPNSAIDPDKVLVSRDYSHPLFDTPALDAQARWHEINGLNRSYFCGAYWGWGFHEDGVRSAYRVVEHLHQMIAEGDSDHAC